jgi:hypothetical protein
LFRRVERGMKLRHLFNVEEAPARLLLVLSDATRGVVLSISPSLRAFEHFRKESNTTVRYNGSPSNNASAARPRFEGACGLPNADGVFCTFDIGTSYILDFLCAEQG